MKKPAIIGIIITLFIFLGFAFFYLELRDVIRDAVGSYGLVALFLIVVLMDFLILPISPDLVVLSATWGGAAYFNTTLVGGVASVIAGVLGYFFGARIGATKFKQWFGAHHLHKGEKLFQKYGVWAVVIGALSPIPYAAVSWSAGIYDMKFNQFLTTIVFTRIPRFMFMGFIGFLL